MGPFWRKKSPEARVMTIMINFLPSFYLALSNKSRGKKKTMLI